MKPLFFLVITGADSYRFTSRAMARAFCAACRMAGHAAIVKSVL
jgi:hypothetical protein